MKILPGLLLAIVVSIIGIELSDLIGQMLGFKKSPVSSIILAILVGMIIGNLINLGDKFGGGFDFSIKRILKLGVILLGIRLSMYDVIKHATIALPLIIVCITIAISMTHVIGKKLQISQKFALLTAVGTSICGATAIVATAPVINANKEETSYAIANVTIFGIIAMILYPYISNFIFESQEHIGYFLGTAIHETAQVAGAGLIYAQQYGSAETFDIATITKLLRNSLMLAVIPVIAYWNYKTENQDGQTKVSIVKLFPLFILGFLAMALVRTMGDAYVSEANMDTWKSTISTTKFTAEFLLTIAMSAIGLSTNLKKFVALGLKPFYLGFIVCTIVGVTSFATIKIFDNIGMM